MSVYVFACVVFFGGGGGVFLKRGLITKEAAKTKTCTSVTETTAVMFLIIMLRRSTAPSTNEMRCSTIMACAHSENITQCNMGRLQTHPVEHISYCKKPFPSKWDSYIRRNSLQSWCHFLLHSASLHRIHTHISQRARSQNKRDIILQYVAVSCDDEGNDHNVKI